MDAKYSDSALSDGIIIIIIIIIIIVIIPTLEHLQRAKYKRRREMV